MSATPTAARTELYDAVSAALPGIPVSATAVYSGTRGLAVTFAPGGMDPDTFYVIARCYATNDAVPEQTQIDLEGLMYVVDAALTAACPRVDWTPRSNEDGTLWMEARCSMPREDF